jgi:carbon monoxide dehydrogenase subunit G
MTGSVCINATAADVWAVLSDIASIERWVPLIQRSYCPEQSRGVGAMRVCELKQATLRETIIAWDEGRSFTYRGEGAPMLKTAINTWSVEPRGEQSLVTSAAEVELKGGFAGRLLEPLMKAMATRMGAQSLASLKYFVEHGEPYVGNVRELLPAPVAC